MILTEYSSREDTASYFETPLWTSVQSWIVVSILLFYCMKGALPHATDDSHGSIYIATGGSPANRAATVVMLSLALALIAKRMTNIWRLVLDSKLLMFIPALSLISCVWSNDAKESVVKGTMLLIEFLFAVYLVDKYSEQQQLEIIELTCRAAIISSIFLVALVPKFGLGYQGNEWRGIFGHKNDLGVFILLLTVPAFYMPRRNDMAGLVRALFVIASLGLIIKSQSRTAWLLTVFFVALIACARLLTRFRRLGAILISAIGSVAVACLAWIAFSNLQFFTSLLNKDTTFSGRTQIWSAVIDAIRNRPLLGYGYSGFWQGGLQGDSGLVIAKIGFSIAHAHDGYLNVALQLGVIGTAVVIASGMFGWSDAIKASRRTESQYLGWSIATILLVFICNLDESYLLFPNEITTFLFILACLGLRQAAKRNRQRRMVEAL